MTEREEDLLRRITANPGIFGSKPIIRGMRISVELVLALLAQGASFSRGILRGNPGRLSHFGAG